MHMVVRTYVLVVYSGTQRQVCGELRVQLRQMRCQRHTKASGEPLPNTTKIQISGTTTGALSLHTYVVNSLYYVIYF